MARAAGMRRFLWAVVIVLAGVGISAMLRHSGHEWFAGYIAGISVGVAWFVWR